MQLGIADHKIIQDAPKECATTGACVRNSVRAHRQVAVQCRIGLLRGAKSLLEIFLAVVFCRIDRGVILLYGAIDLAGCFLIHP